MKKFVLLACVAGVLLAACTKRGPAGPKGDAGLKGDIGLKGVDVRDSSLFNFDGPNIVLKRVTSADNNDTEHSGIASGLASVFNSGTSIIHSATISSDSTVVFLKITPLSASEEGLAVLIPFEEPMSDLASLSLTMDGRLGTPNTESTEEDGEEKIFGLVTTLTRTPAVLRSDDIGYLFPFTPYGKLGDESTRGQAGLISPDKPIGYRPFLAEKVKGLLLLLGKTDDGDTRSFFTSRNYILLTITVQLGNRTTTKHIHLSTR